MEDKLLTGVLILLALFMLALMPKVIRGPRFTDRIVAINAINTMVTASICLLPVCIGRGTCWMWRSSTRFWALRRRRS